MLPSMTFRQYICHRDLSQSRSLGRGYRSAAGALDRSSPTPWDHTLLNVMGFSERHGEGFESSLVVLHLPPLVGVCLGLQLGQREAVQVG
jgi:hypothetical protein